MTFSRMAGRDNFRRYYRQHANTISALNEKQKKRYWPSRKRSSTYSFGIYTNLQEIKEHECVETFDPNETVVENEGDYFCSNFANFTSFGRFNLSNFTTCNGKEQITSKKSLQYFPKNTEHIENGYFDEYFTRPVCNSIESEYTTYSIKVIGGDYVGKSMLIKQMFTSQFICSLDIRGCTSIPVFIDDHKSVLEVAEVEFYEKYERSENDDAFILVYSVSDKRSFKYILKRIAYIRKWKGTDKPVILVANKVDLVEKRLISTEDGKAVAKKFKCIYTETTLTLHFNIDNLLVTLVRSIRQLTSKSSLIKKENRSQRRIFALGSFFRKLFRLKSRRGENYENIPDFELK